MDKGVHDLRNLVGNGLRHHVKGPITSVVEQGRLKYYDGSWTETAQSTATDNAPKYFVLG